MKVSVYLKIIAAFSAISLPVASSVAQTNPCAQINSDLTYYRGLLASANSDKNLFDYARELHLLEEARDNGITVCSQIYGGGSNPNDLADCEMGVWSSFGWEVDMLDQRKQSLDDAVELYQSIVNGLEEQLWQNGCI